METKTSVASHCVVIDQKQKVTVTGVEKVLSVKNHCLSLSTSMGILIFTGKNFAISGFSEKEKTFSFGGEISSAVYQGQKESFIKKFFK